jgi:hypothetical protein
MNRRLALAAFLILFTLVACARTAAGPYPANSPENNDTHGGGDGGSGSM